MKEYSIFIPVAMVATGIIWILINNGTIPAGNLWALTRIWPVLLIGAGLGLIVRSFWAPARALVDLGVVGVAVLAIVFAPQLNWAGPNLSFGILGLGGASGSGHVVTQSREVQGFHAISISYPAEIVVSQGESEYVEIEAEDNLVDQLTTRVEDGKLIIENGERNWARRVTPTRGVRIHIAVKNLDTFDFSSAGKVTIESLTTDQLHIRMSGAGDLNLRNLQTQSLDCGLSGAGSVRADGKADTLKVQMSGMGSFSGDQLLSQQAKINISGAGSASVNATESLEASISGTGSINYHGNPSLIKHISGLGSINKSDQ